MQNVTSDPNMANLVNVKNDAIQSIIVNVKPYANESVKQYVHRTSRKIIQRADQIGYSHKKDE